MDRFSPLPLLVPFVLANNSHRSFATDNLAFCAHLLDRGSNFHGFSLSPPGEDPTKYLVATGQRLRCKMALSITSLFGHRPKKLCKSLAARPGLLHKAFVVSSQHVTFHLGNRVDGDTHYDQKGRTPEVKGHIELCNHQCWQYTDG